MKTGLLGGAWAAIVPLTAAIGVYLVFVFIPGMREIRELRADIAQKEAAIAAAATIPTRLRNIDAEIVATREYVDQWRGMRADPAALSGLFGELSKLVKQSGAQTTMFRPEAKVSLAELERTPLTIGCRGTFSQVQSLLATVEKLPHRIWIEAAKVESNVQNAELVECELRLAIFADKFEISN
ncbi:MAG: type 4a pilus biogenesis protein PilO [Planctomycetales bacterium]|nr:type 4a pilus biogenesis protein PilO [Planctomycetales bacterium]MBN8626116.1 type 4a pilus biogenesis protein PilO [Planctomycetota bacterium]